MDHLAMAIEPYVGVGGLRFGMSRAAVRALLGPATPHPARRTPWSPALTDRYDGIWVTLDYTRADLLEFVEIGASDLPVVLNGVQLMPGLDAVVVAELRAGGATVRPADAGYEV